MYICLFSILCRQADVTHTAPTLGANNLVGADEGGSAHPTNGATDLQAIVNPLGPSLVPFGL